MYSSRATDAVAPVVVLPPHSNGSRWMRLMQLTATLTATGITRGGTPWHRWTTDRAPVLREVPQSDAVDDEAPHF